MIADHENLADMLATMHMTVQPGVLAGLVARHADMLLTLVDRETTTSTVRARIYTVSAQSCAQAGLLGFFGGERQIARYYFSMARTVAEDSDNDILTAKTLVAGSTMYSPIPAGGRGGDVHRSIAMLRKASDSLRTAGPDVNAWAHRWLAMELAAKGEERGFSEAMETAERLTGQPVHHDGRGFFARYTADLNKYGAARDQGVGYVFLSRPGQAANALSAVQVEGNPRRQVTVLTEITAVRMLQGEPEQACQELSSALGLALDRSYPMGIERIRGVRTRFPNDWAQLLCVAELDEQIRVVIASLQRKAVTAV